MNEGFNFPGLGYLHTLEFISDFGVDTFGDELRMFGLVAFPIESEEEFRYFLEEVLFKSGELRRLPNYFTIGVLIDSAFVVFL